MRRTLLGNVFGMSLDGKTKEELLTLESKLLQVLSDQFSGKAGNKTLSRELSWPDDQYWIIRNRLVSQGRLQRGQGKGGSVKLVTAPMSGSESGVRQPMIAEPAAEKVNDRTTESNLYDPIAEVLKAAWKKDMLYRDLVLEVTARQGKRETGGKWTRPDITVAAMTTLLYVPGKIYDVITFEVKASDAIDVTAVYEALSHRRAATRSYVWLHVPDAQADSLQDAVYVTASEAKRHGIGLFTGSDPTDYDTWEELVEAVRTEPDPQKLNEFITVQFSETSQEELLQWMR